MALPPRNERTTYTLRPGDQLLLDPMLRGYVIANADHPVSFLRWDGSLEVFEVLAPDQVLELPSKSDIQLPSDEVRSFPEAAKKLVIKLDDEPMARPAPAEESPAADQASRQALAASGPSAPSEELEFQRLPGRDGFSFIEVALAAGEPIYIMESKCIWTKYPQTVPGATSTLTKALGLLAAKARAMWQAARS